jgi:hypothetical protein
MARGIHGLPKVSHGPAMHNPSTPCGRATAERPHGRFGGWPARKADGLRPSSTPLDTPRRTGLTWLVRWLGNGDGQPQAINLS